MENAVAMEAKQQKYEKEKERKNKKEGGMQGGSWQRRK